MTIADDIAQVWEDVRPIFVEHFHADSYTLSRKQVNAAGGWDTADGFSTIETGRCTFVDTTTLNDAEANGMVYVSMSPYTLELPAGTLATKEDRITVNGRDFLVDGDPKTPGLWDPGFVLVGISERKP